MNFISQLADNRRLAKSTGRVPIRATGPFNIKAGPGQPTVQGIAHRHCRVMQPGNGCGYAAPPDITTADDQQPRNLNGFSGRYRGATFHPCPNGQGIS